MEGIYRTMPIPDINNNNAKGQRQRDDDKPGETDGIRLGPPGFPLHSRKTVIPPPMPFSIGRIPPPPPSQVWEQMLHSRSQVSPCRMAYRGPQPKPKDIPVHLVQQQGPQSTKTVVSPFVCAQEFYQNISSKLRTTASKPSGRGKSDTDNGEHNDSGVVLEGSPGFIGPVLPRNIQLGSPKLLSQEHSKKGLVDYSFSETDESEDDRSRSSQVEKRSREETEGVVVITDDSSSEGESSKRLRILDASRHLKDRKSVLSNVRSFRGDVSSEVKECCQEEGVISADSDEGSSKFHDCSSTLSNYQILQTVLSKKFPENQRKQCSQKRSGDSDLVDLTDDGSEVFSIVSQESTDHAIKSRPTENKGYSPFWASPESRIDSPICGYSVMYPPYTYPGWVSPEMISAGYGHTTPETVQRRHSSTSCPSVTASRKIITQDDSLSTSLEDKHPQPQNEEDKLEEKYKRGSVSIRGMEARLRFLKNSKLTEHDTNNIQSRLNMLQKSKQTEGDSDSQSSMTTSWKVRFINKCRSYKGSYIDSHCHLDFLFNRSGFGGTWSKFKVDNQDTMPYNFDGCVAVFCHPGSFRQDGLWSDLAKEEDVWLTFGCHPKNATEYTERTENNMKVCLLNSKVVAVGEIGLDYSGMFEKHKEVQQIVFRKQIQIALDMNKPLVIHCRDAEEDTLAILDEMVPKNYKIHCHCFTGNYESAKKWLDMFPNLFIGLTPLVTYRTATSTHEVARFIPLERLLLETDAPYFVPRKCPRPEVQHSHPGLAITVAEEIAWLKKCPISEVLYSCRQNTRLMYGI